MSREKPALRRLVDVIDTLIDPHVGIIQHLREVPPEAGDPDFFEYVAKAANTRAFTRQQNFYNTGGASFDRSLAMAKAVGEAVERYCGAIFDVEALPLHSYESAPFACVSPTDFALYSETQYSDPGFPWVTFENSTPIRWVAAVDMHTGSICYVPAAMVYVPYFYYQGAGDAPIVQPISTGLACHCSPTEAAIGAICEVIERDAFTITWQAGLPRAQVRIETLSDGNYQLVQRFERSGSTVTILDITTDVGVPTFLSILRSEMAEAPALVTAGSADLDPEQAVRKSLEELEHTRRYAQFIKDKLPRLCPEPGHGNVQAQADHLNFWADHANLHLADCLFASKVRIGFDEVAHLATDDPQRNLRILLERVASTNHRVLLVDLTTPDVRDLGLSVVRAILPGFHPLFMGYRTRAAGGRRLKEIPKRLGLAGLSLAGGDNPSPHPYP